MPNRKSRSELPLLSPIDFHPPSNGEFMPRRPSPRAVETLQRWLLMVEEKHRRLGMTRRQFANSACGYAAALLAINQAACSSKRSETSNGSGGAGGMNSGPNPVISIPGCGRPTTGTGDAVPMVPGMNSGGQSPMSPAGAPAGAAAPGMGAGGASLVGAGAAASMNTAGPPTSAAGGAAMMAAGGGGSTSGGGAMGPLDAGFMVTEEMTVDMDAATEMLSGEEFIFDVQTHTATEIPEPWEGPAPDERALAFISQIFAQSDTDVAVLSGPPNSRDLGAATVAARDQVREIIDRIGGPRLLIHANADPERGDAEYDFMGELAELYAPSAWKTYPLEGNQLLDSDEVGAPFMDAARALDVLMVVGHRGLWDDGNYTANASPRDMIYAAAAAPDINFLVYHSGYERERNENHPYDPDASDHFGVDRMIRALGETGIGPDGNVYAELGSTWANIMTEPEQAAHVLGKLLSTMGPDRILWGTDCLYNGIPQGQIVAMRTFQIPEQMQEEFGYPALTPEIRAKIFGLNAARIYGVDVDATRTEISVDDVSALRSAFLNEPDSLDIHDHRLYEGPRTRRQFLQLQKQNAFFKHG
jgi:hypothetical protein